MLRRLKPRRRRVSRCARLVTRGSIFDADLRIGREGKSLSRVAEEVFHLRGR